MRWPVAASALIVLGLLLSPLATPQPPPATQAYQARLALGDIPLTPAVEVAGAWNLLQKVRVHHDNGTETTVAIRIPAGMTAGAPTCTCGPVTSESAAGEVRIHIPAASVSGDYDVELPSSRPAGAVELALQPNHPADAYVVVYVPQGHVLDAPVAPSDQRACTAEHPGCVINVFMGTATSPLPLPFTLALQPQGDTATPGDAGGAADDRTPWIYAALAFVAGCIVWALLVRQGVVQKRTRRQSVAVAAHEEIAAKDPPAVLEGRKRALMAALKEIEVAKMNKEMDNETYDKVKADFKRQTVNVMRALESGEGKKPE